MPSVFQEPLRWRWHRQNHERPSPFPNECPIEASQISLTKRAWGEIEALDHTGPYVAGQPSLEAGLRRDGGDAETGAGVDLGGGLIVSDALTGLSADVRVRMLLVHQDQGFRDRGVSLSFGYNSTPSTPLGFMAKLTPSWGGQATSGGPSALGPGDDGRGGGRRSGGGRPSGGRARLRDAGRGPAGRDVELRHRGPPGTGATTAWATA